MNYSHRASVVRVGSESGAALIVAIFVLALVTSIVVAFDVTSIVVARRADNQLRAEQAWDYLTGAEELAIEMIKLRLDSMAEEAPDGLQRLDVMGQFDTDDGWLSFNVVDLQGRFNINSLLAAPIPGSGGGEENIADNIEDAAVQAPPTSLGVAETRTLPQNRFIRLLRSLQQSPIADGEAIAPMSEDEAVAILEAVQDWLDQDVLESGFGGAEQVYYGQQPIPYRPADGPMRDVSELLLIKGITPGIYSILRDQVTVWPVDGSAINVASIGPGMIQALYAQEGSEPMDPELAMTLFVSIQSQEIATMADFLGRPEWGPVALPGEGLVIRSEVFLVSSLTQVGRLRQGLDSVVLIKDNDVQILARSLKML
jgi:general secretion pathway protein K